VADYRTFCTRASIGLWYRRQRGGWIIIGTPTPSCNRRLWAQLLLSNPVVSGDQVMVFDVFMLCLIAGGYVLFLVSLLHDAARLLKLARRRLRVSDADPEDLEIEGQSIRQ
jgi:hypothetical protein